MFRLLLVLLLGFTILFAADSNVKKLEKFYFDTLKADYPNASIETVKVVKSGAVKEASGWKYYKMAIKAKFEGKKITQYRVLFMNKNIVAASIMDIRTRKDLSRKYSLTSKIGSEFYSKDKLVAGNINAKNKLVLFSDPQCPACKMYVPKVVAFAHKHPNSLAVFYSPFPLPMHKASFVVALLTEMAFKNGANKTKIMEKVHSSSKIGRKNTSNPSTIIKTFNSATGEHIKLSDYNKATKLKNELNNKVQFALKLGINSTPSIYYNGVFEKRVNVYLDATK